MPISQAWNQLTKCPQHHKPFYKMTNAKKLSLPVGEYTSRIYFSRSADALLKMMIGSWWLPNLDVWRLPARLFLTPMHLCLQFYRYLFRSFQTKPNFFLIFSLQSTSHHSLFRLDRPTCIFHVHSSNLIIQSRTTKLQRNIVFQNELESMEESSRS